MSTTIAALPATDAATPARSAALIPVKVQTNSDAATMQTVVKSSTALYNALTAYLYLQQGNAGNAYAYLMGAAKIKPDAKLYLQATEVAIRAHSYEPALLALQKWKADFPNDPIANNYHLQVLAYSGHIDRTTVPLQRALDTTEPGKIQTFIYAIPMLYEPAKKPEAALVAASPVLQAAIRKPETAYMAATSLARMQLAARQYPQSLQNLQWAVVHARPPEEKLGPLPNRELAGLIAMDLMRASRATAPDVSKQAYALVRKIMQAAEPSGDFMLAYAKSLIDLKRYDDALLTLKVLLQKTPTNAEAWVLQGGIHMEQKNWQAAQTALQQYLALRSKQLASDANTVAPKPDANRLQGNNALTLNPAAYAELDTQAYVMLARVADALNDPQASSNWLSRIVPASLHTAAKAQRVEWLVQQGKYTLALELLKDIPANTAREKTAKALVASLVYEKQDRFDQAKRVLDEALAQEANNAELLYARGIILERLERFEESEKDLRRVIALKPDSAAAYNALGYSLADRNQRLPEARALVLKALELNPNSSAIQDSMAWVEYRMGKLPEARAILAQVFETDPEAEMAAHYGEVLWKSGERDLARKIWQQGLKLDPKDKVLLETIRRLDAQP